MKRSTKLLASAGVALGVASGTGVAMAATSDDTPDTPIPGDARQRAEDAALAETGGGQVTDTEIGEEEGYYEVEVRLDDGTEVEVQLDEAFTVLSTEEEAADTNSPGDD